MSLLKYEDSPSLPFNHSPQLLAEYLTQGRKGCDLRKDRWCDATPGEWSLPQKLWLRNIIEIGHESLYAPSCSRYTNVPMNKGKYYRLCIYNKLIDEYPYAYLKKFEKSLKEGFQTGYFKHLPDSLARRISFLIDDCLDVGICPITKTYQC